MAWLILSVAVCFEVLATTFMKLSNGFKNWKPALAMVCCFGMSTYLLSLAVREIPVAVTYAIYTGSGVVLISLVGQFYFRQKLDRPAWIGIIMIMTGVILLQIFSKTTSH